MQIQEQVKNIMSCFPIIYKLGTMKYDENIKIKTTKMKIFKDYT